MATKNKNIQSFFLSFPNTLANRQVPFNFKTYSVRRDGYIFVGLNLLLPLLTLIFTSLFIDRSTTTFSLINLLVVFLGFGLSFIHFSFNSTRKLVRSGLLIFFLFNLIPNLLMLLFSALIQNTNNSSQWMTVLEIWLQILAEAIVIFLAFRLTTDLKLRFKLTLKNNWKLLLLITGLVVAISWGLMLLYQLIFADTPLVGDSNNQNSLVEIIRNPESSAIKYFYIFTLFVFTVLIAPLAEELAFRHAWFIGSGARWLALLSAPIYFGFIHVQSGDIEHILSYALNGLVLSLVFNYCKGNVTYSWSSHLAWNLTAFISLFFY